MSDAALKLEIATETVTNCQFTESAVQKETDTENSSDINGAQANLPDLTEDSFINRGNNISACEDDKESVVKDTETVVLDQAATDTLKNSNQDCENRCFDFSRELPTEIHASESDIKAEVNEEHTECHVPESLDKNQTQDKEGENNKDECSVAMEEQYYEQQ